MLPTWILLGIIGAVALLVAGAFLAVIVSALIERHHVQALEPLSDEHLPSSVKAREIAEEATQAGLMFVGVFRDTESALLRVNISVYLSEDGLVMMILPSLARACGYRLCSRMADEVWLVSGEVPGGAAELSSYRIHKHLTGRSLAQVMAFHLDRVAAYESVAVPFDPETIVQDLIAHDRRRAEDVIACGFARWVDAAQTIWRFNLRGACQICANVIQGHTRLNEEASELSGPSYFVSMDDATSSLYPAGTRVRISGHWEWPDGTLGTIAKYPDFVRDFHETGPPQGRFLAAGLALGTKSHKGDLITQWVEFDVPTDDGSGDGPYTGGSVDIRNLTSLTQDR